MPLRKRSGATSARFHIGGGYVAPSSLFSSISYVIEAGEAASSLAYFEQSNQCLEEKKQYAKMIASMVYPAFICTVAIAVVILFMTVLLPQIQGMLDRLGGE